MTEAATSSQPVACSRPLVLASLILTRPGPEGRASQQAVRATWARWHDPCEVRSYFVLGVSNGSLSTHASLDGDLLRVPAREGYTSISLKVLAALRWLDDGAGGTLPHGFRYVLKTDDDAWVCVGGVLRFLAQFPAVRYAGAPSGTRMRVRTSQTRKLHWLDHAYVETFAPQSKQPMSQQGKQPMQYYLPCTR